MSHNEALEKRLRAVYDAFDQRNFKAAIKFCNAGIQKYPECQTFKSLKAVALERSGKMGEALQLVDQVLAAAPPDDHVLNMLLLVLKPANRTQDLVQAYEAACSKQPASEELLQGLFACHVRSFSFVSQQQVAMRLNKLHPCEQYQGWVITALALQAHQAAEQTRLAAQTTPTEGKAGSSTSTSTSSTSSSSAAPATAAAAVSGAAAPKAAGSVVGAGMGADKLLQLAEAMACRLLSKAPAQGGHHSWEAVMLYLGLLQAQGKYDAALSALKGPLASAISLTAERREAEAALLLAKGDLSAAAGLYKQALQDQPDDWAALLLCLDCLLPETASSLPACSSTAVAQMVTGPEASTQPGCQAGGLQALMAAMNLGLSSAPSLQERVQQAEKLISTLNVEAAATPTTSSSSTNASSSSSKENSNNSSSNSNSPSEGSKPSSASVLRGPVLAAVELVRRKLKLGLCDEGELVAALLNYHDRFGHVVSCAMDLFCYLELLSSSSRQELSKQLEAGVQQAELDFKQLQLQQQQQQQGQGADMSSKALVQVLRRQMSARQIQADIGSPCFTDPAAAQAHAQHLMALYASALPLYETLDERERGPADELLWLAAAALVQAATLQQQQTHPSSNSSSLSYLLQAVLALEAAAKGRPYSAPVRLGLTGLHGMLGNARAAAAHFAALDVKHVQHDTLSSHHLLPLLLGLGARGQAETVLQSSCALFEDHLRDAGDTLMQAFRNGTHTKVLEFVCFKERLQRSHSFVLARAERAILNISQAAAAAAAGSGGGSSADAATAAAVSAAVQALPLEVLDSIQWRGMRFNDDFTTRPPWLPPIDGPRHLVILLWWEQQQQQGTAAGGGSSDSGSSSSGSRSAAACWWRQVSAAEADLPQAARLRATMGAAAQQRWLLPHLLHAAVSTGSNSSGSSSSSGGGETGTVVPLPLFALLDRYSACLGHADRQGLEQELDLCWAVSGSADAAAAAAMPVSRQLQLLDAAVFSLADDVQDLLQAAAHAEQQQQGTTSQAGSAAAVCQHSARLVSALQQLQQGISQQLQPSAAAQGCLLPGHVLSTCALLLDTCTWLLMCLEAWSKAIKQAKKKSSKGKKAPTGPQAASTAAAAPQQPPQQEAALHAAVPSLEQLQAAVADLLGQVLMCAEQFLQQRVDDAAAGLLAEFDVSSNDVLKALVGWEQRLSVQLVLMDLLTEQRQLLTQVKSSSSSLRSRAKHITW